MTGNQLVCNGCLAPIELGRSFTWFMAKPYHNECAVNQAVVTHAEAAAMVAAERERCASLCEEIGRGLELNEYEDEAVGAFDAAAAIRAGVKP